MTEATRTKPSGIPVPKEGTAEFEEKYKMARVAIPLVLCIYTLGVFMQQAVGMVYVNIGDQLGQPSLASLITSIPGIVLGVTSIVYGALGDFVSLKKMMVLGTIAFVIGSACGCIEYFGIWGVIVGRALQTAGWQASGTVFLILVSKYTKEHERVAWYGIFVAVFRFSAAAGVFLAGYLTLINWRILLAIGMVEVLAIPLLLHSLPDEHLGGYRIDVIGFVLVGLMAGAITMFFTSWTAALGVLALLTTIVFIVYISRAKDPFVSPKMLTSAPFVLINLVTFVGYLFSYTITPGVNGIGLAVFGVNSAVVSNNLVWSILLAAIIGFVAGPIINWMGRDKSILFALACMAIGLIAVAFAIPYGQTWTLAIAPCVYYFGTSFFYQPVVDTAALTVEPEESGRALGFNGMIQAISGSIGVAFLGRLIANNAMSNGSLFGIAKGSASTYANVFIMGAALVFSALIIFLFAKKTIYREQHDK